MNKRKAMKRGTDHTWELRKYKGDGAWYINCKCGYETGCYKFNNNPFHISLGWVPSYCANCGAKKKWITELIKIDKARWE